MGLFSSFARLDERRVTSERTANEQLFRCYPKYLMNGVESVPVRTVPMDRTYKALGNPTRRRILRLLRDGDRTAGDLASQFSMSWASVSHHLNVLKGAGLVLGERDGQFIRYSLNTTVFQELLGHLMDLMPRREPIPRRERDAADA
jgi:DNA-binding transcriptional ArsR family regulator